VKRHHGTFLYEEEHETVVFVTTDGNLVQVRVEMVVVSSAIGALDTQLLDLNRVHTFNDFLAKGLFQAMVQKVAIVAGFARLKAHPFYCLYKIFHATHFNVKISRLII